MKNFFKKIFCFLFCSDDTSTEETQRDFSGEPEVLAFCKDHFKRIAVGMYLFTDNTISYRLQEGKKVRAVIVSKQGKSIYCLLPEEKMLKYDLDYDYREFSSQQLIADGNMKCIKLLPSLLLLQAMHYYVHELNQALEGAGQPRLTGTYWSWFDDRPYFIYSPTEGEKYFVNEMRSAKVRFVLKLTLT